MKKYLKLNDNDELFIYSQNNVRSIIKVKGEFIEVVEPENPDVYYNINVTSFTAIKCLSYLFYE